MLWECEIRTQWDDEGEKENHKLKLNICHIESPKSQPHLRNTFNGMTPHEAVESVKEIITLTTIHKSGQRNEPNRTLCNVKLNI